MYCSRECQKSNWVVHKKKCGLIDAKYKATKAEIPMVDMLAYEHAMDLMWLKRTRNEGLRERIPFNMMLTGRDQEAYAFTKWWLYQFRSERCVEHTFLH